MAGYSGVPLPRKLDIKPGQRVRSVGTPRDVDVAALVAPLPEGAALSSRSGPADRVLVWAEDAASLDRRLPAAVEAMLPDGAVWVVWPKKSSQRWRSGRRDISEDVVRQLALSLGVVDVKVCAVDETWSGLKLVRRLRDR